jgi:hypothetical protein
MNDKLSLLSRARRPVWIEGPGAFGATLAAALDATFVDVREADARAFVETLQVTKSGGRPVVVGLADTPRAELMAVLFALLHDQLHGPSGTEDWSDGPPLWIVAPRAGLADDVASRLRLHARADALGLDTRAAPRGAIKATTPKAEAIKPGAAARPAAPRAAPPARPAAASTASRAPRAAADASTPPRPRGR